MSLHTDNQTGSWEIGVNSDSPYSVKVTGESDWSWELMRFFYLKVNFYIHRTCLCSHQVKVQ